MQDGGLYIAGRTPNKLAHHQWIRMANTWVVRAANIRFPDGTAHLTPGYPTHYNGQYFDLIYLGQHGQVKIYAPCILHALTMLTQYPLTSRSTAPSPRLPNALRGPGILLYMC